MKITPPVYVFDSGLKSLVKIVKRGRVWCVYRLDTVKVDRIGNTVFIFEDCPYASWHYKPFEDKDVSSTPDQYLKDIKCWQPHKIQRILGLLELSEKFSLAALIEATR